MSSVPKTKKLPEEEIPSLIVLISSPNQNFAPPYLTIPKKLKAITSDGKAYKKVFRVVSNSKLVRDNIKKKEKALQRIDQPIIGNNMFKV